MMIIVFWVYTLGSSFLRKLPFLHLHPQGTYKEHAEFHPVATLSSAAAKCASTGIPRGSEFGIQWDFRSMGVAV